MRQIIAALAVVSLSAGCTPSPWVSTAAPTARPTPGTSPTPVARPLEVPLTVPVILVYDPAKADQVDGITWDGTTSGRIAISGGNRVGAPGAQPGIVPNPTGTLYAENDDRGIYDRTGALLARWFGGTQWDFGRWADDGRHYCQMSPGSGLITAPATLVLGAVGEQLRNVTELGPFNNSSAVAACSIERDRAVVFGVERSGELFAPTLWVVRLSDGRVVWKRSYLPPLMGSASTPTDIVASRDGRYIAEDRGDSATLLDTNGSILARIAGDIRAFSWDGSLVVVTVLNRPSVIRWRDGQVVWRAPEGLEYWNALAEPAGPHVAVAVLTADMRACFTGGCPTWPGRLPFEDLYVVAPDGQAATLLTMTSVAFPACTLQETRC